MIRNLTFRRLVVALLLLLGPLTQFQTLYACELMGDGKPKMVCCCDEPGEMGAMGCKMDGACQDQPMNGGMMGDAMIGDGCCELSYQPSQTAEASHPGSHAQQVVMLDAPQPPPIPVSFNLPELVPTGHVVVFVSRFSLPLPDEPVYLLTNRFRI